MSRIRSVHPGLWTDEAFVSLSGFARLLLIGVWTECDDKGVFAWSPLQLKMRILPADNVDTGELLAELIASGCVRKYEIGGKCYGAVRNFAKYQRPKKPNDIHPANAEILAFAGHNSEPSENEQDVVPNQFPTDGENPPQMEDGGWREGEEPKGSSAPMDAPLTTRVELAWKEQVKNGLLPSEGMDSARRKALRTRVKEHGEQKVFDAINRLGSSPWHCGKNDDGWRASLGWLLKSPENFLKALELPEPPEKRSSTPQDRATHLASKIEFYRKIGKDWEADECQRELAKLTGPPAEITAH